MQRSTDHLGAWDVLLRVGKVDVKGVCTPCDALKKESRLPSILLDEVGNFHHYKRWDILSYLVLVGLSVGEVGGLSCLPPKKPIQVGTCFLVHVMTELQKFKQIA